VSYCAWGAARFALPYDDPKQSDGTPTEVKTYDERCRQIAREMLYMSPCSSTKALISLLNLLQCWAIQRERMASVTPGWSIGTSCIISP